LAPCPVRITAIPFGLSPASVPRSLLKGGQTVLENSRSNVRVNGDLHRLDLDAHLVVLVVGLGALVLGVLVRGAPAMVKDGNHRGGGALVHGHVEGGDAGADAGERGREGGRGSDEGREGKILGGHCFGNQ
jgi:hypothetical protein